MIGFFYYLCGMKYIKELIERYKEWELKEVTFYFNDMFITVNNITIMLFFLGVFCVVFGVINVLIKNSL